MTLLPDLDETRVDQETDAGYPAGRTTAGSRPPVNASPDLDFGAGVELALAASNHLFNAPQRPPVRGAGAAGRQRRGHQN